MAYEWPDTWFDDYNYKADKPISYLLLRALRNAIGWLRDNAYFGDRIDVTNDGYLYFEGTQTSGAWNTQTNLERTISGLINLPAPPAGKKWKITVIATLKAVHTTNETTTFYLYANPFTGAAQALKASFSVTTVGGVYTPPEFAAGAEVTVTLSWNETGEICYFMSARTSSIRMVYRRACVYIQSEDV